MKKFFFPFLFCFLATEAIYAQSGTVGTLSWSLIGNELSITGIGNIPDYDIDAKFFAPWYELRNSITSIRIDEGVEGIGKYAFYMLRDVTSAVIPNTTVTIDSKSFYFCDNLSSIHIPASVNSIDPSFMQECYNLNEITVDPENLHYSSKEGVLFNKGITTLVAFPCGKGGSYSIPETVSTVTGGAFMYSQITSLTIPATVTFIEPYAFAYCPNLTEVVNKSTIPQDVTITTFWQLVFANCTLRVPAVTIEIYQTSPGWEEFTNIKPLEINGVIDAIIWTYYDGALTVSGTDGIPDNFTNTLAAMYPELKTSIQSVVIEEGITIIGEAAFSRCHQISSVSISGTVTIIGSAAFEYCTSLTSITIPSSVNTIHRFFVAGCTSLTSILVEEGNEYFVSVDGVLFNKDRTWLVAFPVGRQGNFSYDIPESVEIIGDDVFYECIGLISVTIPTGVKSIGSCAFWSCSSLTSVIIPNGVTAIYMRAFENCENLTSVFLPASINFIESSVFGNCITLSEFVNAGKAPIMINSNVFWGVDLTLCKLMVPSGSIEDYGYDPVWSNFGQIMMLDAELKLDKTEMYLLSGATAEITATVFFGLDLDEIEWNSSRPDIVMVDNAETFETIQSSSWLDVGTVTAIKSGSTDIYAVAFGNEASCRVTVIQPGNSAIEGTVNNSGTANVRVNLYMKPPDSNTKKGIIGGYVLLATVIPNDDGEYRFDDLPEGTYQVDVEIDNYESESSPEIKLSDNEIRPDINFVVDEKTGTVAPKVITGVEELLHTDDIKTYPNPFTDVVHVTGTDWAVVDTGHALHLQVINTAGATVHTQTVTNPHEAIQLGHLPVGMYFIRLENGKQTKTVKVIKD